MPDVVACSKQFDKQFSKQFDAGHLAGWAILCIIRAWELPWASVAAARFFCGFEARCRGWDFGMQFLLHGGLAADVGEAMIRHGHRVHRIVELTDQTPALGSPEELFADLAQRQWCLLTADRDFIHSVYDQGLSFPLCMVLLLGEPSERSAAVDRLFERYKRLSPKRLYTVTPGRVKVRQLPG